MIATATEGGAALFPIFYYNKEAFLAQSPQLYKEQLTMSFEKVFEIAPIFRAEPSRTNRHLSEAISIDFEEAYVDYNDVMSRIEQIIKQTILSMQEFSKDNDNVEFIEQPLHSNQDKKMDNLPIEIRKICAADESLHSPKDAERLACEPNKFGIYNIKLMKCGGINPSLKIASAAYAAGIDLMWGCMDESIISISAALHAAMACNATKYIDLDGSFDLAKDLVSGGFNLKDLSLIHI